MVVPVYNGQATLTELVTRLGIVLAGISAPFEVLLINDGSKDRSWNVIRELSKNHDWVRGIDLMRNFGQHNALLCGIRHAAHEITVTMDDDLQHPPDEIPKLLERLAEGYDVVYGKPQHEMHSFWRNFASRTTKLVLAGILGADTAANVSAFRAFRTQLRDGFTNYQSPYVSIDVLLAWQTTRFTYVKVRHDPRVEAASNYNFRKLMTQAFNMMTGFSVFPLQAATLLGFALTLFGIALLVYVLGSYLVHGSTVPGFTFLASIISIFSGAQLFALGIIGEYLARMHFRSMEKPPYVIRWWSKSENGRDGKQSSRRKRKVGRE